MGGRCYFNRHLSLLPRHRPSFPDAQWTGAPQMAATFISLNRGGSSVHFPALRRPTGNVGATWSCPGWFFTNRRPVAPRVKSPALCPLRYASDTQPGAPQAAPIYPNGDIAGGCLPMCGPAPDRGRREWGCTEDHVGVFIGMWGVVYNGWHRLEHEI